MSNQHPVRTYFMDVRSGWKPSPKDVEELARRVIDGTPDAGMSFASLRDRLQADAERIIELRAAGSFGPARAHAREARDLILATLGDDFRGNADPLAAETDPGKLAAAAHGDTPVADLDPEDPAALAAQLDRF